MEANAKKAATVETQRPAATAAHAATFDSYMDAYAPLPPGALPATGADLNDPDIAEIPAGEEPVATGTLFIMIIFLMMIGALWGIVYFMLLNR